MMPLASYRGRSGVPAISKGAPIFFGAVKNGNSQNTTYVLGIFVFWGAPRPLLALRHDTINISTW